MRRVLALICISIVQLSLLQSPTAIGQTFNLTNGVGSWTVDGNWTPGTFPNSIGASANFNGVTGAGGLTVSLSAGVTVGSLTITNENSGIDTFNNPNLFTLSQQTGGLLTFDQTADASAQLTVNGTSTNLNNVRVSTNIQLNDALSVNINNTSVSSATLLSGTISGTGGLIKNGTGGLTVSGTNTYGGGTTVSAGTLIGTTSSLQGSIINNGAVKFDQNTNGSYAGNMSGTGSLTKAGSGAVTVSGTNSYAGGTNVEAGKLVVASAGSVSHGTSDFLVKNLAIAEVNGAVTAKMLTVENGGTLSGSGTITAETVTVNGTVNPGISPGTLTINSSLVLTSTATLNFELNEINRAIGSGVNDLIVVNGNLTLDGTLNVPGGSWNTSGTLASPLSWRLFEFTGALTNNGLTLGSLPTLTGTPAPQYWQLEVVVNTGGSGGHVNLNAVPEPSVAGLLACALSGTFALRRRRRQSA